MTYDQKSWDLAGHFLDDVIPESDYRRAIKQRALAEHIQQAIEEWLSEENL